MCCSWGKSHSLTVIFSSISRTLCLIGCKLLTGESGGSENDVRIGMNFGRTKRFLTLCMSLKVHRRQLFNHESFFLVFRNMFSDWSYMRKEEQLCVGAHFLTKIKIFEVFFRCRKVFATLHRTKNELSTSKITLIQFPETLLTFFSYKLCSLETTSSKWR